MYVIKGHVIWQIYYLHSNWYKNEMLEQLIIWKIIRAFVTPYTKINSTCTESQMQKPEP